MRKAFLLLVSLLLMAFACSCASNIPLYEGETRSRFSDVSMDLLRSTVSANPDALQGIQTSGMYILQDVTFLSGRTLTGMTLPVFKTLATDKKGDFILTIARFKIGSNKFEEVADSRVEVRINAQSYGLVPNKTQVNMFIDIDLRPYGITLADDETIGFCAKTDTIGLAAIHPIETDLIAQLYRDNPAAGGFFGAGGMGGTFNSTVCPVNFSWQACEADAEKESEEEAYAKLAAQLRNEFEGKRISVLGDSISTFGGITNSASYNSHITGNRVYYNATEKMPSWEFTYWGRLINDLGLQPCVINGWSSARVYGRDTDDYNDSGILRAQYLSNENGTPDDASDDIRPDLILIYMGINDYNNLGLSKADVAGTFAKGDVEAVGKWFEGVFAKSEGATAFEHDVNYDSFDAAYALMLYRLVQLYPDARIIALGFMGNAKTARSDSGLAQYNRIVENLCDYFGVEFLDWGSSIAIDKGTSYYYTVDAGGSALHPNPNGHLLMEKQILDFISKN